MTAQPPLDDPDRRTDTSEPSSSETAGAWKVAVVGVAGALAGSLIGVWGSVWATDRQLDAARDTVRIEHRAQAYEDYLAAVEKAKSSLGSATVLSVDPAPKPLTQAQIEATAQRLIDLQYGLNGPLATLRVYGSGAASDAAGILKTEFTDAIARAIASEVSPTDKAAKNALNDQLSAVDDAQNDLIEIVRREIP